MFAYGYDAADGGCRPVDLVTGPANVYGVAAKRLLRGVVGIDSEAGPTEIAILADADADAAFVAADLISQAEHDPLAASVVVTDSEDLSRAVALELSRQVARTKHGERVEAALTGQQSGVFLVDDLAQGEEVVNGYALSTCRSTPVMPPSAPVESATPGRSSSARTPRSRLATTAPDPTTCCRPLGAPATPPVFRSAHSSRRFRSSTTQQGR